MSNKFDCFYDYLKNDVGFENLTLKEICQRMYNQGYSDNDEGGKEIPIEEVSREILSEPVNRVIAVGTSDIASPVAKLASRSGSVFDKSQARVITCVATAYDGSYETLGYSNPRTCLGKVPTVGTVAVDPKVIPLGTRMYIESVDGSYVYGECFAGDTGGAIKGNRVDLFMASRSQALAFGRKQVKVYILD
jgi:3D (Asp-Asp-Asp) domain-containing protein